MTVDPSEGTAGDRPGPEFLSTEHLAAAAIVEFVAGTLPPGPAQRARQHLARCAECRSAVAEQREARRALRASGPIEMPADLRRRLAGLEGVLGHEQAGSPRPTRLRDRLRRRRRR